MTIIRLQTLISAPPERCFDLARSIEFHIHSMSHTGERAIAGKQSGLINQHESVTWEARHFGIRQKLSSVISEFIPGRMFTDEMTRGAFKKIKHIHNFLPENGKTIMKDIFIYDVPFGIAGKIFNIICLKKYMTSLLIRKNLLLKRTLESDQWKKYLNENK